MSSNTPEELVARWARAFAKNPDNTGVSHNEYYDLISTEDALTEYEDKPTRNNEETQQVKK